MKYLMVVIKFSIWLLPSSDFTFRFSLAFFVIFFLSIS